MIIGGVAQCNVVTSNLEAGLNEPIMPYPVSSHRQLQEEIIQMPKTLERAQISAHTCGIMHGMDSRLQWDIDSLLKTPRHEPVIKNQTINLLHLPNALSLVNLLRQLRQHVEPSCSHCAQSAHHNATTRCCQVIPVAV